jgi:hypothetical protein
MARAKLFRLGCVLQGERFTCPIGITDRGAKLIGSVANDEYGLRGGEWS